MPLRLNECSLLYGTIIPHEVLGIGLVPVVDDELGVDSMLADQTAVAH